MAVMPKYRIFHTADSGPGPLVEDIECDMLDASDGQGFAFCTGGIRLWVNKTEVARLSLLDEDGQ